MINGFHRQKFFQQAASTEKCFTARQVNQIYKDPNNYVCLTLLIRNLKPFSRINKLFKLQNADVVSLGEDFFLFYQSISSKVLQKIVTPSKLQAVPANNLFCCDFKIDIMHQNCVHFRYAVLNSIEKHEHSVSDIIEVNQGV